MFSILFLGDIVGKIGRHVVRDELAALRQQHQPAIVVANGENAAGGLGIEPRTADEIFAAGVDVITTGNHIWSKKEVVSYLDSHCARIIRPYNYPPNAPGKGTVIWKAPNGASVAIVNLLGRVFMPELLDCPFRAADEVLAGEEGKADYVIVDIHAEATSEKIAMGYHLDGRATLVVGTHTHVQTADERLLPKGTAYITDVGMCGPYDSVLGIKSEIIVEKFITGLPARFDLAKGPASLNGVIVHCDEQTNKPVEIKRISLIN
jgi:2',3'-cyclic-nucleotide 2'-phosphodiesterase